MRLRHTSPAQRGWTRRRSGKGFVYLDEHGHRITDPETVDRLRGLAVPPAWQDVWLTPYRNGHLQAVGTDAAGRRQYQYHPEWSAQRSERKHAHVIDFARRLPAARKRVRQDLQLSGMPRERVLATAFRLLDRGLFRIGGEHYAEENGSFGLATLRKDHLQLRDGLLSFDFVAKSGNQRKLLLDDGSLLEVLTVLRRRRGGGEELLAWRDGAGWHDLVSDDINAYLKAVVSPEVSAKDFRTWHATVLTAVTLADRPRPRSESAAKREVARAMKQVSEYMGNTPAVCRASYVDPRVIDRFLDGVQLPAARRRPVSTGTQGGALELPPPSPAVEKAVLRLLDG